MTAEGRHSLSAGARTKISCLPMAREAYRHADASSLQYETYVLFLRLQNYKLFFNGRYLNFRLSYKFRHMTALVETNILQIFITYYISASYRILIQNMSYLAIKIKKIFRFFRIFRTILNP